MNRILKTGLLLVALNGLTLSLSACEEFYGTSTINMFVDANPYHDGNPFCAVGPCVDAEIVTNPFPEDASPDTGGYNAFPDAGPDVNPTDAQAPEETR